MNHIFQINTDDNQKEQKKHGDYAFPVLVSEESIGRYDGSSFLWHWHPEIELTWIMKGKIQYFVNNEQYLLEPGEGLFCSSNALHSGYMLNNESCEYVSVTFHPRFIYGYESSILQTKYTNIILAGTDQASIKLSPEIPWQHNVLDNIQKIYALHKNPPDDYELELHLLLTEIWQKLYHYYSKLPEKETHASSHLDRLKAILEYVHDHYAEPLTLEEIAEDVGLSRSECCRFFKKHMNMTLFEYLMFYRIQQSLPMLRRQESITKIAGLAGFSNPCYYGKIFKRYMSCSPSQYRKEQMEKMKKSNRKKEMSGKLT